MKLDLRCHTSKVKGQHKLRGTGLEPWPYRNKLAVLMIPKRRTNLMNSGLENAISNGDFLH